jgi:hypothetical protein
VPVLDELDTQWPQGFSDTWGIEPMVMITKNRHDAVGGGKLSEGP